MVHDINYITSNPAIKDHWVKRAIAYIIDIFLIIIIQIIISIIFIMILVGGLVAGAATGNIYAVSGFIIGIAFLYIILLAIEISYFVIMDTKYKGTVGKKLMHLRVESLEGEMTFAKGFTRNLSKIFAIILGVFIPSFWLWILILILILGIDVYLGTGETADPRQKYTDKMAGTTVVRTDLVEDISAMSYMPPPPPVSAPATSTSESKDFTGGVEVRSEEGEQAEEIPEEVKNFVEFFEISEERALNLSKAGYKRLEDFKDAIPADLIIVDKINPTVARAIIKKVNEELGK